MRSLRSKASQIAGLCGFSRSAAIHVGRNMPKHWPQPGRGHRDLLLETSAAVALAVGFSGPPGESGRYVDLIGSLRRSRVSDEEFTNPAELEARNAQIREADEGGDVVIEDAVFRPDLLSTLVGFTDRMRRGPDRDKLAAQAPQAVVEIVQASADPRLLGTWARIRFVTESGKRVGFFYENREQPPPGPESLAARETVIRDTKTLPGGLFLALARMLRQEDERRSGAPPEIENPEPAAATAGSSGSSGDQPADDKTSHRRKLGADNSEHKTRARGRAMPDLLFLLGGCAPSPSLGDDCHGGHAPY